MKLFLISDNLDTYTGMRLAGIDGIVVHEKNEFVEALDKAMADKEIGVILVTERFNKEYPEIIEDVKLNKRIPLVIYIPDRHGSDSGSDFILSYINQAIGIKL